MSEELRPCPFCGGKAVTSTFFDWDDLEYMPIEVNDSESIDGEVTCENERCINGWWLSQKDWNTRPIEDELNRRIAELEAAQRWIPVSERLPEDLQSVVIITNDSITGIVRYLELYGREGFGAWSEDVTHWMPLPQPPEVQE